MTKLNSIILGFVLMTACQIKGSDRDASIDYEVKKNLNYSILTLKIDIVDTLANQASEIDLNPLVDQVTSDIRQNNQVEFFINMPDYLKKIIELISSSTDRDKAVKIYNENNESSAIRTNSSQDITIKNGKRLTNIKLDIVLFITNKGTTTLEISPLDFRLKDVNYKTRKLLIRLNE